MQATMKCSPVRIVGTVRYSGRLPWSTRFRISSISSRLILSDGRLADNTLALRDLLFCQRSLAARTLPISPVWMRQFRSFHRLLLLLRNAQQGALGSMKALLIPSYSSAPLLLPVHRGLIISHCSGVSSICTLRYDGESPQWIIGLSFLRITVRIMSSFPPCRKTQQGKFRLLAIAASLICSVRRRMKLAYMHDQSGHRAAVLIADFAVGQRRTIRSRGTSDRPLDYLCVLFRCFTPHFNSNVVQIHRSPLVLTLHFAPHTPLMQTRAFVPLG